MPYSPSPDGHNEQSESPVRNMPGMEEGGFAKIPLAGFAGLCSVAIRREGLFDG
jgi:hypothetical protein